MCNVTFQRRLILAGVKKSDLRELVQSKLKAQGSQCQCIRCREVGHRLAVDHVKPDLEKVKILTQRYEASEGTRIFHFSRRPRKQRFAWVTCVCVFLLRRLTDQKSLLCHQRLCGNSTFTGNLFQLENTLKAHGSIKGYGQILLKEAERMAGEEFGFEKAFSYQCVRNKKVLHAFRVRTRWSLRFKKTGELSMSQIENSGYKGEALHLLKQADCDVGDILRVTSKGKTYEGILIPRLLGEGTAIIIKMKSGYNIGIQATADVKVEKIGKGTKPTFASPPIPKQNPALPHVVIMSTGGTIASRVDYRTGAVRSAISASDLYGVVPELADVARVDTEIVFSIYSENITQKHWTELARNRCQTHRARRRWHSNCSWHRHDGLHFSRVELCTAESCLFQLFLLAHSVPLTDPAATQQQTSSAQ